LRRAACLSGCPIGPAEIFVRLNSGGNGLVITYQDLEGRAFKNNHGTREHRQPRSHAAADQSATGLPPGDFIFGHPRVAGGAPPQLAIDSRRITDNGSLLVFRRLAQDVSAFLKFCTDQSQALQPQWPGLRAPQLASLIVGRWPSGAPAHSSVTTDPGVVNDDPDNSFDFHGDLTGATCPFGAHIRKVNPRKGPADVVDVPRLLRRGIPFGPTIETAPAAERGLLFPTRRFCDFSNGKRPGADIALITSRESRFRLIGSDLFRLRRNAVSGASALRRRHAAKLVRGTLSS
jgi:hypothetical protein